MKYVVLIVDGASGWPLPERGNRTSLELARTPNLDAMAREAYLGLAATVPEGMEPNSACACLSVLGYDPVVHYPGRSAIEATSLGIDIGADEAAFRCNLVAVHDGRMSSYSAGHITSSEAREIISTLNEKLGNERVRFFPGTSYRHIVKIAGGRDTLQAVCTPPHDISGQPVEKFLPRGPGSGLLKELMQRSEAVLKDHPVNVGRLARGETPATTIWLFWGSGRPAMIPSFREIHGLSAALTSGVDLLRGLARMINVEVLEIAGVTDNVDNDYAAQARGALEAFGTHDLAIIHVEAPDEAGHAGAINDKIAAIGSVDKEIVARLRSQGRQGFRVLLMPDHPTPVTIRTHCAEPVPFLLWGDGFSSSGASRFTEAEAKATGISIVPGHTLLRKLISG